MSDNQTSKLATALVELHRDGFSLRRDLCLQMMRSVYKTPWWDELRKDTLTVGATKLDCAKIDLALECDDMELLEDAVKGLLEAKQPCTKATLSTLVNAYNYTLSRRDSAAPEVDPWLESIGTSKDNLDRKFADSNMDPVRIHRVYIEKKPFAMSKEWQAIFAVTAKFHPENVKELMAMLEKVFSGSGPEVEKKQLDLAWEAIAGAGDWRAGMTLRRLMLSSKREMTERYRARHIDACRIAGSLFGLKLCEKLDSKAPKATAAAPNDASALGPEYYKAMIVAKAACEGVSLARKFAQSLRKDFADHADSGKILCAIMAIESTPKRAVREFTMNRKNFLVSVEAIHEYITVLELAQDRSGLKTLSRQMRDGREKSIGVTSSGVNIANVILHTMTASNAPLPKNVLYELIDSASTKDMETRAILYKARSKNTKDPSALEKEIMKTPDTLIPYVILSVLPHLDRFQPQPLCYRVLRNFTHDHPFLWRMLTIRLVTAHLREADPRLSKLTVTDLTTHKAAAEELSKLVGPLSGSDYRMVTDALLALINDTAARHTLRKEITRLDLPTPHVHNLLDGLLLGGKKNIELVRDVLAVLAERRAVLPPGSALGCIRILTDSRTDTIKAEVDRKDSILTLVRATQRYGDPLMMICEALVLKRLMPLDLELALAVVPPREDNVSIFLEQYLTEIAPVVAKRVHTNEQTDGDAVSFSESLVQRIGGEYRLPASFVERIELAAGHKLSPTTLTQDSRQPPTRIDGDAENETEAEVQVDVNVDEMSDPLKFRRVLEELPDRQLKRHLATMISRGEEFSSPKLSNALRLASLKGADGNQLLWELSYFFQPQ